MFLSVIIPSKNFTNLKRCVEGLSDWGPGLRKTILDDGLAESGYRRDTFDYEDGAILDGTTIIPGPKPFVFAVNCNIGIRSCAPDDVVLLNDDAILETPGGFTAMQQFCYEHPEYGLLSARVKGHAHHIHAYKQGLTGISEAPLDIPFVCVYIPRKVIDKVGLLDERFTGSIDGEMVYAGEDTDYCMRIRHAGYKLGVFNECVVDHGTLPSTFRGLNGSLPINATKKRFQEIHGFPMWSR